jgi:hypothetical protein
MEQLNRRHIAKFTSPTNQRNRFACRSHKDGLTGACGGDVLFAGDFGVEDHFNKSLITGFLQSRAAFFYRIGAKKYSGPDRSVKQVIFCRLDKAAESKPKTRMLRVKRGKANHNGHFD